VICSIIKPYVEIVWSLSSTTPCGVLTVFKSPFTSAFTDTVHIHRDSKDRKNQKIINARGGAPAGGRGGGGGGGPRPPRAAAGTPSACGVCKVFCYFCTAFYGVPYARRKTFHFHE
jgi:hypothetical protein